MIGIYYHQRFQFAAVHTPANNDNNSAGGPKDQAVAGVISDSGISGNGVRPGAYGSGRQQDETGNYLLIACDMDTNGGGGGGEVYVLGLLRLFGEHSRGAYNLEGILDGSRDGLPVFFSNAT